MIDQDFVDNVLTIAVNESKVFYLAQWAMSADGEAREQRFEEIVDEFVPKYRAQLRREGYSIPLIGPNSTRIAIARELQEYYESESRF